MGNLIIKAKQNKKTAQYAERKEFFDVAVSRFYYYVYQVILDYITCHNLSGYKNYKRKKKIEAIKKEEPVELHLYTVEFFLKTIMVNLKEFDMLYYGYIQNIQKLRQIRNNSDYKDTIMTNEQFKKQFKLHFSKIDAIFKEYNLI